MKNVIMLKILLIIKNESFNNYENLIKEIIKKRNLKRTEVSAEDDDMKYIKKYLPKEKKEKY